ncbi:MAG: histidine phosphatase family protein [Actinomycetota bacterium]
MTQKTRLILARHAEPARWTRGRCIGRTDAGLSREGVRQARSLATALRGADIDAVVSSPAIRALRTAGPIGVAASVSQDVDADLREIDFGTFDGLRFSTIARERPDVYSRWMASPTAAEFPEGESWSDLQGRARAAFRRIAKTHEGRTTVVVTHIGVILAILADVLAIADDRIFGYTIGHARVCIIDADGTPLVRAVDLGGTSGTLRSLK